MKNNIVFQKGFTLVEMSIVMAVIGLLIGAVLKGQELVTGTRIKRMVTDVKHTEMAVRQFYDTYGGMPGDILDAQVRIPNCNAEHFCVNGDANGVVGESTHVYVQSTVLDYLSAPTSEALQFWKHLALADLIGNVNGGANSAEPEFGQTHPKSAFGHGGFEFYYDVLTTIHPFGTHLFRLSNEKSLSGGPVDWNVTPEIAWRIDKIMDDGMPNSGNVFANYARLQDQCKSGSLIQSTYNTATSHNLCIMFFKYTP